MFKKTAGVFILAIMFSLGSSSAFAQQTRQETDNKIREMANETYVNRLFTEADGGTKTSDKQQLTFEDETSFFTIILDFIGL